ncbi:MAG: sigma-70 family RNA polymerase sigma factor [Blastocatellia bacterium]
MDSDPPESVTDLLRKWNEGDDQAFARLIPLVYGELQRMARQCLRGERSGHTMQTAALVNEAYLRLIDCNQLQWQDRRHFFAIAARVMRRVLVEEARKRNSRKRGAGVITILFDEAMAVSPERDEELLALDEALERLEERSERTCRVVELRYFIGLSIEETSEVLGVSVDVVKREWRVAKKWLRRELGGKETGNGSTSQSANQSDGGSGTAETD